jgi:hypothetical protein
MRSHVTERPSRRVTRFYIRKQSPDLRFAGRYAVAADWNVLADAPHLLAHALR